MLAAGAPLEDADADGRAWASAAGAGGGPPEPAPAESAGLAAVARGAARIGAAALTPVARPALALAAPAGTVLRAAALAAAPRRERRLDDLHERLVALGARFDGRLRIAAVERRTGRRVMFGAPGAPQAEVADAVLASCAIPWVFAPVGIGGRDYVDGGLWSPTNLDAAPAARGARVLCLVPTAGPLLARQPFGEAVRTAVSAVTATEAAALRSRGASVRLVRPDARSSAAMGGDLMDPGPRSAVLAAGRAQGRALAGGT